MIYVQLINPSVSGCDYGSMVVLVHKYTDDKGRKHGQIVLKEPVERRIPLINRYKHRTKFYSQLPLVDTHIF